MADQDVLELDALEPPFNVDPYSTFARLRQEPVRRVRMLGLPAWLVTRYEDVRQALADPRLSNDVRNASPAAIAAAPWLDAREAFGIGRNMMQTDPPDHTRLRRLVGAAFTPGRIEALRPRIQQIADELVDEFLPRGRADLVEEFAIPLPTTVIMELLGVPAQDRHDFKRWNDVAAAEPDDPAEAIAAYRSIVSYLGELIARKERELAAGTGADDLLTALIAARDEGGRLSHEELLSMGWLLLAAGLETVADLIGTGTLALLGSPDQLAALRRDPTLLESAIEELLRYDGPIHTAICRFTTAEVEIGGVVIPGGGEPVLLATAAADRDPARFADPDALDLRRDTVGHLGFGHGVHFCLGAPLARLESRIAFRTLLDRCADLALAVPVSELQWRRSANLRGVKHLPVTFTAA
jgi:cytochrome P450